MVSDADRFRLAVALSVLKYKPVEQSFPSKSDNDMKWDFTQKQVAYVLDLRSKFPLPSGVSSNELWRSFALKMECDYLTLKEKYDAERIKCLSLESAIAPSTVPVDQDSAKKKSKKKQNLLAPVSITVKGARAPMVPADLKSVLADPDIGLPRISPSHSLFSHLDEFVQLSFLPETNQELLSAVTSRLIGSIAKHIRDIIYLPSHNLLPDGRMLEHLAVVLNSILTSTFPSFMASKSDTSIIEVFNKVTTRLLTPLIHAFSPQSQMYLQSLLLPHLNGAKSATSSAGTGTNQSNRPPAAADIRAEMLTLFRTTFCLISQKLQLCSTQARLSLEHHTLQASLVLDTVREIDRLLFAAPVLRSSTNPVICGAGTGHMMQRVTRLATKETLWYLCAVLNIVFDESSGRVDYSGPQLGVASTRGQRRNNNNNESRKAVIERKEDVRDEQLLSKAISDAFFRLVTRCKQAPSKSSMYHHRCRSGESRQYDAETLDQQQHEAESTYGERWLGSGLRHISGVTRGVVEVSGVRLGGKHRGDDSRRPDGKVFDVGAGDDDGGVESYVNAAGLDGGCDCGAASVPQGACELGSKEYHGEGTIEIDQVGYGMLLGVVERYWVWSGSWEKS